MRIEPKKSHLAQATRDCPSADTVQDVGQRNGWETAASNRPAPSSEPDEPGRLETTTRSLEKLGKGIG